MANCSVTKLNAVVNNDSLDLFGVLTLGMTIPNDSAETVYAIDVCPFDEAPVTIEVLQGDIVLTNNNGTENYGSKHTFTYPSSITRGYFKFNGSTKGTVFFNLSKYVLGRIHLNRNLGDSVPQFIGKDNNIKHLNNCLGTKYIKLNGQTSGDISVLKTIPLLEYVSADSTTLLEGDFSELGSLQYLTKIYMDSDGVYGSVDGFVTNKVNAGILSASSLEVRTKHITFGEYDLQALVNWNLSWSNSGGKILVFNITRSVAYTKGYTLAEAQTAASGLNTYIAVDGAY